jgi:hypothetical protein
LDHNKNGLLKKNSGSNHSKVQGLQLKKKKKKERTKSENIPKYSQNFTPDILFLFF